MRLDGAGRSLITDRLGEDLARLAALFETLAATYGAHTKVSADDIRANGWNLDRTNPNKVVEELGDPDELLARYRKHDKEAKAARDEPKRILAACLQ